MKNVEVTLFGCLTDGKEIHQYTLTNNQGTKVMVINLGAIITQLHTADAQGQIDDVVLGFDNLTQYLTDSPYFGAIVGRYGNRIANGEFSLNEQTYQLVHNNGENHLHGGLCGFDKKIWVTEIKGPAHVQMSLFSPDMEEGYPGDINLTVDYQLSDDNQLLVRYKATSSKDTVFNPTQHSYFNLDGHNAGDVLAHELMIQAQHYTPVDETLIPTGEIASVNQTALDFTKAKTIGKDIHAQEQQLIIGGGYDHNFVFDETDNPLAKPVARVYSAKSGRTMQVYTDQPGMQLYTANFLDGSFSAKQGAIYQQYAGLCLETQHFPDSPNQPTFPSTVLKAGETFSSFTIFAFSTH